MALFSKDSLELLRTRIDLVEVLSAFLPLTQSGAMFKTLCPFHEEKTPSFMIKRGDSHYHCFGCGAHGDAIDFLLNHEKMGFLDAVEYLAEKFQVPLEYAEKKEKGPNKQALKELLEKAVEFYHFYLLHTKEGHEALSYLFQRGIELDFVKAFQFGLSPKEPLLSRYLLSQKIGKEELYEAGLLKTQGEFFQGRIMIPIRDAMGHTIGFTARKYLDDPGPKYVNSPETPLFKKSKVLVGLLYSRRDITKERKAIIVEGQIDALRLIHSGITLTVAGQGTAFTEEHGEELLHLGVQTVYLSLDPDTAGREAAIKTGDLFQKKKVDVRVISLPDGLDPDLFIRQRGKEEFLKLLEQSEDYLTFLVKTLSLQFPSTPSGKGELVRTIVERVRKWENAVMVHESLKRLADLTGTPFSALGLQGFTSPNIYIQKDSKVERSSIDPDLLLEEEFVSCLFSMGLKDPFFISMARLNMKEELFTHEKVKVLYVLFLKHYEEFSDLLSFASVLSEEDLLFFSALMQKKIVKEKAKNAFLELLQKLLDRTWIRKREEIAKKIQVCSSQEILLLVKEFDELTNARPKLLFPA